MKEVTGATAPAVDADTSTFSKTADTYGVVQTTATGPEIPNDGTAAFTGLVTTGQIIQCLDVEPAAATYTVSVQFKSSSGSLTAKERKHWVEAVGF